MSTANRCGNCGQILGTAVVGADGIARCVFCSGHSGWQAGRPSLQSVITWIRVSERLPDVERLVLLGNYGDDTSRYGWKSRIPGFWSLGADFRPLHAFSLWAELPTLPAGAEGEG